MSRAYDIPFIAMVVMCVYLVPQSANAYVDATTGSYALQTALAAAFAVMFYARGLWSWITRRGQSQSQERDRS